MSGQRLQRWPDIEQALVQHVLLSGIAVYAVSSGHQFLYRSIIATKVRQCPHTLLQCCVNASCQVKKKSEKNSDWPEHTHPTMQFFFFFGNMYSNNKNHKKTQNNTELQKKWFGAWPTHQLQRFSLDFWIFSTRQNPFAHTLTRTTLIRLLNMSHT